MEFDRCPTCESPYPSMHPATQAEGEVMYICKDIWHSVPLEGSTIQGNLPVSNLTVGLTNLSEGERKMNAELSLETNVVNLLVTTHDMDIEEAEDAVKNSKDDNPGVWNENADAKDLAKLLASDDDDE